jgi:hypothetical protein
LYRVVPGPNDQTHAPGFAVDVTIVSHRQNVGLYLYISTFCYEMAWNCCLSLTLHYVSIFMALI